MDSCDVLIVGGGPGGAACAWQLRRAGLDVVVVDRARFPRDKTCAGWVTPQVLRALDVDLDEYSVTRTLQPITAFHVGLIGDEHEVTVRYPEPVSVGIRRCEFDDYLLRRAGARLWLGESFVSLRRDGSWWVVNDAIRTPMLVGAGGHFCPVARMLSPGDPPTRVVAAQEVEVPLDQVELPELREPNLVSLFFARDLTGYGWCFRKRSCVNIGFGQYESAALPKAVDAFVTFLAERGMARPRQPWRWHGHAYRLYQDRRAQVVDAGVLLVGDAAGLAYSESGEGIRPAVESGLLAASTIIAARGRYSLSALAPYERALTERLGVGRRRWPPALQRVRARVVSGLAPSMLTSAWFVRRVLVNRWFLHAAEQPLVTA
jgi:flavin-dependent dehydrogenase